LTLLDHHGEVTKTLVEPTLMQVYLQLHQTGQIVQSRYSQTDGTFVDNIQTANTEEQCMVRT